MQDNLKILKLDFNRSGSSLIEIVTEPNIKTVESSLVFIKGFKYFLSKNFLSKSNMQKGNFRVDVNISVKSINEKKLGYKTEIKNLNSFKFLKISLHKEIHRQKDVIRKGKKIKNF